MGSGLDQVSLFLHILHYFVMSGHWCSSRVLFALRVRAFLTVLVNPWVRRFLKISFANRYLVSMDPVLLGAQTVATVLQALCLLL
jgi:hypothetical protein